MYRVIHLLCLHRLVGFHSSAFFADETTKRLSRILVVDYLIFILTCRESYTIGSISGPIRLTIHTS